MVAMGCVKIFREPLSALIHVEGQNISSTNAKVVCELLITPWLKIVNAHELQLYFSLLFGSLCRTHHHVTSLLRPSCISRVTCLRYFLKHFFSQHSLPFIVKVSYHSVLFIHESKTWLVLIFFRLSSSLNTFLKCHGTGLSLSSAVGHVYCPYFLPAYYSIYQYNVLGLYSKLS
jgi:hypothetical protein